MTNGNDTLPVTVVTKDAAKLEYMHNADYVRMVAALNKEFGKSYRWMEKESGCDVSFAQWAQIADGNRKLNPATRKGVRTMIAKVEELRDELPAIPDPVELVSADLIHPDAEMVLVGTLDPGERVRRVLLMAANDVTVHVNGAIVATALQGAENAQHGETYPNADVTHVTDRRTAQGANYAPTYRPRLPVELRDRVQASGVDVATLIERGLSMEVTNE